MKNVIEKISNNVVKIIFVMITLILLICSIFNTAYMEIDEKTLYKNDNFILNICCIIVFSIIVAFIKNKYNSNKIKFKINRKIIILGIIVWIIICIAWIFSTQLYPRADQKYLVDIASQMKEHNFKAFDKGRIYF